MGYFKIALMLVKVLIGFSFAYSYIDERKKEYLIMALTMIGLIIVDVLELFIK